MPRVLPILLALLLSVVNNDNSANAQDCVRFIPSNNGCRQNDELPTPAQVSRVCVTLPSWCAIHFLSAVVTDPVKELILSGESFLVDGRPAFILLPPVEKRTAPQPWVMYAPTLPGLPDEHEKWMHEQFLAAGLAVAGIDVGEAYGSPTSRKWYDALYQELTKQRSFATKCCLLGRSRGGLWNSSWAIHNPEKVAGMAGIYPVFDLKSWPGVERAAPAFELSPEKLTASLQEHNPIERIDVLAKAGVKVFLIHGDDDHVVPLEKNSAEVVRRYAAAKGGELIKLTIAPGQGHNYWPGFFHCQELIDFVIKTAREGAQSR